jgi:hypothetical protein
MPTNQSLRRFLAAGAYLATFGGLSAFASRALAADLPACEHGRELGNEMLHLYDARGFTFKDYKLSDVSPPAGTRAQVVSKDGYVSYAETAGALVKNSYPVPILIQYADGEAKLKVSGISDFDFGNSRVRTDPTSKSIWMNDQPIREGRLQLAIRGQESPDSLMLFSLTNASRNHFVVHDKWKNLESIPDKITIALLLDGEIIVTRVVNVAAWKAFKKRHVAQQKKIAAKKDAGKCQAAPCFFTTAACEVVGLADDCWELNTLRGFRDGYLSQRRDGAADVARYYAEGAMILDALKRRPDAVSRLLELYWLTILPCALGIKLGLNRLAWSLYRRRFHALREEMIQ